VFKDPGRRIFIDLGIVEIPDKGSYFQNLIFIADFNFVSACVVYISLWFVIHIPNIVSNDFVLYCIAKTVTIRRVNIILRWRENRIIAQ
jgi:hypothetical protein